MSLRDKYFLEAVPKLKEDLKIKNDLEAPRVSRIVVNTGIGKIADQENLVKAIVADLNKITGQKPIFTLAKKAISGFKLKQGSPVGVLVTLRGRRMWEFLERLIVATLPRIKDFQGVGERNFNSSGDCSVGIKEQTVFPEINPDETNFIFGLEVSLVTTAKSKKEGMALLKALGFPVRGD